MEEQRCYTEDDFYRIYRKCTLSKLSIKEKQKMTLQGWDWTYDAGREWEQLIIKEKDWFKKNGFIDVIFDGEKYKRKKLSVGRPPKKRTLNNTLTLRLDDDTLKMLNDYCSKMKMDQSQAVRQAIKMMCY